MKALILVDSQSHALCQAEPLAMMPLIHQPLLEIMIEQLRMNGVAQIMIHSSRRLQQIEHYFGSGHRFGVQIDYAFDGYEEDGKFYDAPSGSAGAIRKIDDHSGFFDSTFLVLRGDVWLNLDLSALLTFHQQKKALTSIALTRLPHAVREVSRQRIFVQQNNDGRLRAFQANPIANQSALGHAGIFVFEPEILRWIPTGQYDIERQLLVHLIHSNAALYGLNLPFPCLDMGRVEDYHCAVMQAMCGLAPPFQVPGRQLRPGLFVGTNVRGNFERMHCSGKIYIGPGSTIGEACSLHGPLVIGAGSQIEAGSYLENTIVLEHTRIGVSSNIQNKVIGNAYCADADGSMLAAAPNTSGWQHRDSRNSSECLSERQRLLLASGRPHLS